MGIFMCSIYLPSVGQHFVYKCLHSTKQSLLMWLWYSRSYQCLLVATAKTSVVIKVLIRTRGLLCEVNHAEDYDLHRRVPMFGCAFE